MYDSYVGVFKSKTDYDIAAQKAMAARFFLSGYNENDKRLKIIRAEYETYFGKVVFEKNNPEMVTITKEHCHHNFIWEMKEVV